MCFDQKGEDLELAKQGFNTTNGVLLAICQFSILLTLTTYFLSEFYIKCKQFFKDKGGVFVVMPIG